MSPQSLFNLCERYLNIRFKKMFAEGAFIVNFRCRFFCSCDIKNFTRIPSWICLFKVRLTGITVFVFVTVFVCFKWESTFAESDSRAKKGKVATYRFYDALRAGEHRAHDGEILGIGHPPLAHVFEHFSSCRSSQRVFGVKAHICVDASRENTKSSSEDEPWKTQHSAFQAVPATMCD